MNQEQFTKRELRYGQDGEHSKELLWPKSDDYCWKIIMRDWQEYRNDIFAATPERKVVIQAGGNAGLYPFLYGLDFAKIFTFEPDPINFYCLTTNCSYTNIAKFNTALGDKCEWINLHPSIYHDNNGMPTVSKDKQGFPIYCITIDSLEIEDISLIHLDVEGFEYNILKGAKKTIEKCKPTVVVEIVDDEADKKIFKLMQKYKYAPIKELIGPNDANPLNIIYVPIERA